ncbi:MAG: hypothetical protein AB7O24_20435 [Kofleriaceae bacterium]
MKRDSVGVTKGFSARGSGTQVAQRVAMNKAGMVLLALAGCSSLDDSVGTDVVTTEIAVTAGAPDALATITATVELTALSRAEHEIAVDSAALRLPTGELPLDLETSPSTPFLIHANESATIRFTNVSTTNAELLSLCGQTVGFFVQFEFLDDQDEATAASSGVTVSCR